MITAAELLATDVKRKVDEHPEFGVWVSPPVAVNKAADRHPIAYFDGPSSGRTLTYETRKGWRNGGQRTVLAAGCWILDGFSPAPVVAEARLRSVLALLGVPRNQAWLTR